MVEAVITLKTEIRGCGDRVGTETSSRLLGCGLPACGGISCGSEGRTRLRWYSGKREKRQYV